MLAPPSGVQTHGAQASVATGVAVALLHLQLALDPREARQAGARVAALPRVHAGGAVLTRMVVGAEVQVCGRIKTNNGDDSACRVIEGKSQGDI